MFKPAIGLLQAKLLKRKKPLVVGWAITDQCNRKCAYCAIWRRPERDLPLEQVTAIIDDLAEAGALRISFTGGEPLLRQDMGDIISYAHEKGIETKMNSNGSLVKEKIDALRHLDLLTLSLDGPMEIHDAIRGRGAFADVQAALRAAREQGVKTSLATVLTSTNLDAVDAILDIARQASCRVTFQPATTMRLGGQIKNDLTPPAGPYRETLNHLIIRKKAGDQHIANSVSGLSHLQKWPEPTSMACASGWISCRIEPDGSVLYCSRESFPFQPGNCVEASFQEAFNKLRPVVCNDCWCAARVELNLAYALNLPVLLNLVNNRVD